MDVNRILNEWGASGLLSFGCVCIRFPEPRIWRILSGRTQMAMMAAATVEMNLEMAQRLSTLRLPAALLPSMLATAMQDFVDQAEPADANDRAALDQYARSLGRDVVADYVAATATLDGPLISGDTADSNGAVMGRSLRTSAVAVMLGLAGSVLTLAQPPQGPSPSAVAVARGTSSPSSTEAPAVPAPVVSPSSPVVISAPSPEAYVSGATMLRAAVDPSVTVQSVAFFVDGRQLCSATEPPFECEWDAGSTISAHLIRIVVTPIDGDRIVRTMRTKGLGYADRVVVEAIQVTVTVTDDAGRFVGGIPRAAFRVFEDGRPQPITYFASEDVPLELLVAVDISGSMTTAMPRLKKAVKDFLVAVPAKDQVTLLGFNDSVFALTRKTTDLAERVRAVDRLAPWGATALYDVIVRAVDMLGRQVGRKALVVFSDGEDQGSHVSLEDVERKLQASDVTLYMIAQGRGDQPGLPEEDDAAADRADRRAHLHHRQRGSTARRVRRVARRALQSVSPRISTDQRCA